MAIQQSGAPNFRFVFATNFQKLRGDCHELRGDCHELHELTRIKRGSDLEGGITYLDLKSFLPDDTFVSKV